MFVPQSSLFWTRRAWGIENWWGIALKPLEEMARKPTLLKHSRENAHRFRTSTLMCEIFRCQFYECSGAEERTKIFPGFMSEPSLTVKNVKNRICCGSVFCQQLWTSELNEKTKQRKMCSCASWKNGGMDKYGWYCLRHMVTLNLRLLEPLVLLFNTFTIRLLHCRVHLEI